MNANHTSKYFEYLDRVVYSFPENEHDIKDALIALKMLEADIVKLAGEHGFDDEKHSKHFRFSEPKRWIESVRDTLNQGYTVSQGSHPTLSSDISFLRDSYDFFFKNYPKWK